MSLHPRIQEVTERIRQRSALLRRTYLDGIDAAHREGPQRARLSCGNLAHAFAACGPTDKGRLRADVTPNLGIINAYNDMLSAHQPFEHYPEIIRTLARENSDSSMPGRPWVTPSHIAGTPPATCAVAPISRASVRMISG